MGVNPNLSIVQNNAPSYLLFPIFANYPSLPFRTLKSLSNLIPAFLRNRCQI